LPVTIAPTTRLSPPDAVYRLPRRGRDQDQIGIEFVSNADPIRNRIKQTADHMR